MFELDLIGVEEHRHRGERRPPRWQREALPQQYVDRESHEQAKHVLHGYDQHEAVQRSQDPQQQAVARYPADIGLVP